jgi:hypothetical protein
VTAFAEALSALYDIDDAQGDDQHAVIDIHPDCLVVILDDFATWGRWASALMLDREPIKPDEPRPYIAVVEVLLAGFLVMVVLGDRFPAERLAVAA